MPENLYPQLPTAPPMSQESFNIEMVRKYYQDIANLKEKYTEKQRKYKNAYNRLLHASTGASTVGVVSGVSTIGTAFTGDPSQHRSQDIVERYNRMLSDRLFSYQYHKELEDPSKSNREWVSRLQNVVSTLNNEKTRLIGMKPIDAIKQTLVEQGFSQPTKEYEEKLLDVGTKVRYLYEPG